MEGKRGGGSRRPTPPHTTPEREGGRCCYAGGWSTVVGPRGSRQPRRRQKERGRRARGQGNTLDVGDDGEQGCRQADLDRRLESGDRWQPCDPWVQELGFRAPRVRILPQKSTLVRVLSLEARWFLFLLLLLISMKLLISDYSSFRLNSNWLSVNWGNFSVNWMIPYICTVVVPK